MFELNMFELNMFEWNIWNVTLIISFEFAQFKYGSERLGETETQIKLQKPRIKPINAGW